MPSCSALTQGKHVPLVVSCQLKRVEILITSAPSPAANGRERASCGLSFAAVCPESYPQLPSHWSSHLPAPGTRPSPLPRRREGPFLSPFICDLRRTRRRCPAVCAGSHLAPAALLQSVLRDTSLISSFACTAAGFRHLSSRRGLPFCLFSVAARGERRRRPVAFFVSRPVASETATGCAWRHLH